MSLTEHDNIGIIARDFVSDGRESVFYVFGLHPHIELHYAQLPLIPAAEARNTAKEYKGRRQCDMLEELFHCNYLIK